MTDISPRKISGEWSSGYALDIHTISSEFVGYNSYGHAEFNTKYSDVGKLLHDYKYGGDRKALEPLAKTASKFILDKKFEIDLIIPVPPSRKARLTQPVVELAKRISEIVEIPVCLDCIQKVKDTEELKGVPTYAQRIKILKDVFSAKIELIRGRKILLVDDLYRSGATLDELSRILCKQGGAEKVMLLTMTRTRSLS